MKDPKRLAAMGFVKEATRIKNNQCPTCGGSCLFFADNKSRREFEISGMCQQCQDSFFGTGEDK